MPDFSNWLSRLTWFWNRSQRQIWVGAFVLTASFFSARAASLLVSHWLLPPELGEVSTVSPSGLAGPARPDIRRIISRNLFDSRAQDRVVVLEREPEIDDDEVRPSTISAELLGTVVFRNSRYSVALIRDRSANATNFYSIGERVLDATVFRIERFRVILQRGGRLESLEVQAAMSQMPAPAPTTITMRGRRPGPEPDEFEQIGPGRFVIPQETVDGLLTNLPDILRAARAVPNISSGNQIDGFRMLEIRSGSIYEKLGIQNGDIVKRVNNDDLNSVEKGMNLFNALRNEKTISIDIERGGSRLNYTYEIR